MAEPLSEDLRRRIVNASENKEGAIPELAKRFAVSERVVSKLVAQWRKEGHLKPKPHSGGRTTQKVFELHLQALQRYLEAEPDLTNPELVERLVDEFGEEVRVDPSQISRILKQAGLTRKKKSSTTRR